MATSEPGPDPVVGDGVSPRYERDSPEFGRVANLSDAVFAIAMTLLVLTLDAPGQDEGPLLEALVDRVPQLIAFVLAFALVANIWWAHHRLVAHLGVLDRGLIALTLVLLGAVALVPFPTSLIGDAPTEQAAVLPFIGLFVVILGLFLLLYLQAERAAAWRHPMPEGLFPWLVAYWLLSVGGMLLAFLVAIWAPVGGLVLAAASGTVVGLVLQWRAPRAYRSWTP
jgi:uncharacterized membrane protein